MLVSGLAVLAVVGAGAVISVDRADEPADMAVADAPPDVALATDVYSWARGSVLHTATGQIDVGHPIEAYVRTAVGSVFTDGAGSVYAVDAVGIDRVGVTTDVRPRLVSDPQGDLVGWVDPSGERPAFVVLDQSTGVLTRDDSHTRPGMPLLDDAAGAALVYAIDGVTLYLRDERGAVAVDTSTGRERVIDPRAVPGATVSGAGSGLIAFETDTGTAIGAAREGARLIDGLYGSPVLFSPDGRYVTSDTESLGVYDVVSGARVDPDLDRGFSTGYEWLGDGTLVVLAAERARGDADAELLTCDVPTGVCETVVPSIGTFDELERDGAAQGGLPTG